MSMFRSVILVLGVAGAAWEESPMGGYNLHSVSFSQSTLGEGFVSVPEYSVRISLA